MIEKGIIRKLNEQWVDEFSGNTAPLPDGWEEA